MSVNIQLPDDLGAVVKAQAQEQGVSTDRFVTGVLKDALGLKLEQARKDGPPFETGYGMWAKYGPAPSAEEIDENRREMFRNFAQDF
jgi:hypothetical protein